MTERGQTALYASAKVQDMLGLSRSELAAIVEAGFVAPERDARGRQMFRFQDLMLLRTAHSLRQAGIPSRKILKSLAKLQAELPDDLPLTGLRLTAVGDDVAVRDRRGQWEADSGQWLMDFEVVPEAGAVRFLAAHAPASRTASSPASSSPGADRNWFSEAEALERSDNEAASAAYRSAIEADPLDVRAYLNLTAMLCEAGCFTDAVSVFELALQKGIANPMLHFNHAMALEGLQKHRQAFAAYENSLALDPDFADAHYNVAVLAEKLGDARAALRHFNAYRRLQRSGR